MHPQFFPLEKILTVSARDYCESQGKELSDYRMVGVHAVESFLRTISQRFYEQAGKAEVIVDYRFSCIPEEATKEMIIASGTALIPHKKEDFT